MKDIKNKNNQLTSFINSMKINIFALNSNLINRYKL